MLEQEHISCESCMYNQGKCDIYGIQTSALVLCRMYLTNPARPECIALLALPARVGLPEIQGVSVGYWQLADSFGYYRRHPGEVSLNLMIILLSLLTFARTSAIYRGAREMFVV